MAKNRLLFTIHIYHLRLVALRKTEHAFGDDVALNLAGARLDGVAARAQVGVLPDAVVEVFELPVGTEELLRRLLHALVPFTPEELLNRAFCAWDAGFA